MIFPVSFYYFYVLVPLVLSLGLVWLETLLLFVTSDSSSLQSLWVPWAAYAFSILKKRLPFLFCKFSVTVSLSASSLSAVSWQSFGCVSAVSQQSLSSLSASSAVSYQSFGCLSVLSQLTFTSEHTSSHQRSTKYFKCCDFFHFSLLRGNLVFLTRLRLECLFGQVIGMQTVC